MFNFSLESNSVNIGWWMNIGLLIDFVRYLALDGCCETCLVRHGWWIVESGLWDIVDIVDILYIEDILGIVDMVGIG